MGLNIRECNLKGTISGGYRRGIIPFQVICLIEQKPVNRWKKAGKRYAPPSSADQLLPSRDHLLGKRSVHRH